MSLWLTHPLFIPSLVVGITILLWATSLLPEFITALLFFAVAMVAKIAPPDVIFGGFASSAFWLVFSGFVLGSAIRKTGLADRAARALSSRLTDSWPLMVASVVLLSYALAFVMPSNMGRIALLMPIVAAMAKRAGINEGTRAWYGLALAVGFGTFQLSATILPANVPNLVMSGARKALTASTSIIFPICCCIRRFWVGLKARCSLCLSAGCSLASRMRRAISRRRSR
ncbi:putative transport protein [Citrobacter portucalensis]|nr:putative transport protein [Citrobacter portucalensis]